MTDYEVAPQPMISLSGITPCARFRASAVISGAGPPDDPQFAVQDKARRC